MESVIGYIRFKTNETEIFKKATISAMKELAEKKGYQLNDVVTVTSDLKASAITKELNNFKYGGIKKIFVFSYMKILDDNNLLKDFLLEMNYNNIEVISYCESSGIDYLDFKLEVNDTIMKHYYDYQV